MRTTQLRLATALLRRGSAANFALLPPIPLYRRLLRAHRKFLPQKMRLLGDEYVKAEFRAHRNVDNPIQIEGEKIGFLTEWQLYAQKVEGESWVGEKLDPAKVEKMNTQQIGQLYQLMKAIQEDAADEGHEESWKGTAH